MTKLAENNPQGSSLQQCLIAGVFETAEVYAKMAHNVLQISEGTNSVGIV
jgi:hypothetical protein